MNEQVEYEVEAYIKCLGDMENKLWVKRMDLVLPVIVEIKNPFAF